MLDIDFTTYISLARSYWDTVLLQHGNILLGTVFWAIFAIIAGGILSLKLQRKSEASARSKSLYSLAASLIAPLLLLLGLAGAYGYAQSLGGDVSFQLFALRLGFSWFIVRLVLGLSSKQEAGWIISFIVLPFIILLVLGVVEDLSRIMNGLALQLGDVRVTALMVVKGLAAIIVLFWLAGKVLRLLNQRVQNISSLHISHRTLVSKLAQTLVYFIVFILAMQIIGVDLTALSVFGGALGVGIGFGLQKIASNFISGIILLLERSIQVGDLVELDDGVMGFIRRTGARYTLMETFDCREILIPNEEFISQRTVSWTHSNKTARIQIDIGVAYDSDLELAQKIMLEEAQKHNRCIKTPPPFCFLDAFADSSINLTLYFYVSNVEDGRLEPRSDVMLAIWKRFKAEGIEIPFPQRVLHYATATR